jgi:hypothetical protein
MNEFYPTVHLRYKQVRRSGVILGLPILQQRWDRLLDGGAIPVRIEAEWRDVPIEFSDAK